MMRKITGPLFLLFLGNLYGQYNKPDYIHYRIGRNTYTRYASEYRAFSIDYQKVKAHIFLEVQNKFRVSKKTGNKIPSESTVKIYDSAGRTLSILMSDAKQKNVVLDSFQYNQQGSILSEQIWINGKLNYTISYTYNAENRILSYAFLTGQKQKLRTCKKYVWENGKMTHKYTFANDTNRFTFHFTNNYMNDTGDLLNTVVENSKGQKKYTWDYECSHLGTLSRGERKNETRYCKTRQTLDDGNTQEIWISEMGKEMYRSIREFDSADQLVRYWTYGGKAGDRLIAYFHTENSGDSTWYITEYYNDRGVVYNSSISVKYAGQVIYSEHNFFGRKGNKPNQWITSFEYQNGLESHQYSYNPKKRFRYGQEIEIQYSARL